MGKQDDDRRRLALEYQDDLLAAIDRDEPEHVTDGETAPVVAAARAGNIDVFHLLLQRGADIRGRWGPMVLFEIDRQRTNVVWQARGENCEKIYQLVDRALKRNTQRAAWLRPK